MKTLNDLDIGKIKSTYKNNYNQIQGVFLNVQSSFLSGIYDRYWKDLDSANIVAAHTGRVTLNLASAVPNPGPRTNPSPKATPIRPNVLARFSGVEISASIAVAVAAVPPLIPSITRARNKNVKGILMFQ